MIRSLLLGLALACAAVAQAQAPAGSFVWQSRNANLAELSMEFGRLYATLLEASTQGLGVDTYAYFGDTHRGIEAILREQRLVAGRYFPREADLYVCQLNPSVCRVTVNAGVRTAKWVNRPTDELRLPRLEFEPVIVHREFAKRAEDRLRTIVVTERGGCSQYDDACRKYLENLNRVPLAVLEGRYAGLVLVPTLAYRTRVAWVGPGGAAVPAAAASAVEQLLAHQPGFARGIVPNVDFRFHATEAAAAGEGTRQKILELTAHPFARRADIPAGRVHVGVFDTWLDATHCDIAGAIESYVDAGSAPPGVTRQPCGTPGRASEPFDHGTHVVGLLVGRRDGKSGPGMNPNARIHYVRINPQQMKNDDAGYLNHVADRLNEIYQTNPVEVVNLSFEYPFPQGLNDTFLGEIAAKRIRTLFVASAGNLNQELRAGGVCAVRPACGGAANLITTAALNLSDKQPALDASNYGSAVHIAAPGKGVVSTLSGGRIGAMSGTSQAAPLVAGAASLLMLKNPRLYPEAVKNRLIYTADLFPTLAQQVLGGRLNVTRALEFDKAQLQLGGASLQGDVVNLGSRLALRDVETGKPVYPKWEWVRRLRYEKAWGYFWMYWKREGGGPLERSFVTPLNAKQAVQFHSPQAVPALQTYPLGKVADYVAAIPSDAQ